MTTSRESDANAAAAAALSDALNEAQRRNQALIEACEAALGWVENMRIVPGGERDRLRKQLRRALGKEA